MTGGQTRVLGCPVCGRRTRVPSWASGEPRCAHCQGALPWLVTADDASFGAATAAARTVLVYLWAPWCRSCRTLGPAVDDLADRYAGRLKVVTVNVDHARQTSSRLRALAVPTLLLMRDGEILARQVGASSPAALRRWVERLGMLSPTS
jgi:thioredoxin 2